MSDPEALKKKIYTLFVLLWFCNISQPTLLSYVFITKIDIIEMLLIRISKLIDIPDKKTASLISNSCIISDKIIVEKSNLHRYQTHFEIHIQFEFSSFHC